MLNIVSKSLVSNFARGPKMVVENLIAGLKKIDVPYVSNRALDSTETLWIHDDKTALKRLCSVRKPPQNVVIGPNVAIPPHITPEVSCVDDPVFAHPSQWVIDFRREFGDESETMQPWAVGIDTQEFAPDPNKTRDTVMIYFKHRFAEELKQVTNFLNKKDIAYDIIRYGDYTPKEYKKTLQRSRYGIWVGSSESQGIALLEALSMDVPLIVWDVNTFKDYELPPRFQRKYTEDMQLWPNLTTAPYFDDRCGVKVDDITSVKDSIRQMESEWQEFAPREYVLESFTLVKSAERFLDLFPHSIEHQQDVSKLPPGKNATIFGTMKIRAKDWARTLKKSVWL